MNKIKDTNTITTNKKVLGIPWNEEKDNFIFDFNELISTARSLKSH